MIKNFQRLTIFIFVYCTFFFPEISLSQTINPTTLSFSGKNYNISIPKGYCDITKTPEGIFLINHLLDVIKNVKMQLPEPKIIFTKCNYNINNIYPWGYIGFLNNNTNSIAMPELSVIKHLAFCIELMFSYVSSSINFSLENLSLI